MEDEEQEASSALERDIAVDIAAAAAAAADAAREPPLPQLHSPHKRPATSYEAEVRGKRLQLLDYELEHHRLRNQKAAYEARQARYEADLAELRLKEERARLRHLGI